MTSPVNIIPLPLVFSPPANPYLFAPPRLTCIITPLARCLVPVLCRPRPPSLRAVRCISAQCPPVFVSRTLRGLGPESSLHPLRYTPRPLIGCFSCFSPLDLRRVTFVRSSTLFLAHSFLPWPLHLVLTGPGAAWRIRVRPGIAHSTPCVEGRPASRTLHLWPFCRMHFFFRCPRSSR